MNKGLFDLSERIVGGKCDDYVMFSDLFDLFKKPARQIPGGALYLFGDLRGDLGGALLRAGARYIVRDAEQILIDPADV